MYLCSNLTCWEGWLEERNNGRPSGCKIAITKKSGSRTHRKTMMETKSGLGIVEEAAIVILVWVVSVAVYFEFFAKTL